MTPFTKYQATGNDFLLFEKSPFEDKKKQAWIVQKLCDRNFGVGANGVLYLWKNNEMWYWRLFNEDGSEADACGNGARCVAHYLDRQHNAGATPIWQWKGAAGSTIKAKREKSGYAVSWPISSQKKKIPEDLMDFLMGFNDRGFAHADLVDVGIPHLVLVNHELWNPQDRLANGPALRHHQTLAKEGANVTWVSLKTLECVTFERGVEGETLSCGSGAIAAHIALNEWQEKKENNRIFTFPGGRLKVRTENGETWLQGEAHEVFKGEIQEF